MEPPSLTPVLASPLCRKVIVFVLFYIFPAQMHLHLCPGTTGFVSPPPWLRTLYSVVELASRWAFCTSCIGSPLLLSLPAPYWRISLASLIFLNSILYRCTEKSPRIGINSHICSSWGGGLYSQRKAWDKINKSCLFTNQYQKNPSAITFHFSKDLKISERSVSFIV